ncbi:hypothetical protein JHD48_03330 [Sulfurimonas sp. SAG-AH-194-I05]|nr:hypothetical protein [Sulfurimonas sp. SAG-AH-194-I05]MDF1874766.1 hypothetical protein [Sulfurimonas sp. SAG-AH-194-I05]
MKYLLFILPFLFFGCSTKNYEQTKSKVIIIKSPKLKFADLGYIRNTGKAIELELFIAGQSVEKFTINHLICARAGCLSKSGFNADYLHESYPDSILQNILLARVIYEGVNQVQTGNGFTQKIKNEHVDITYKVSPHVTFFKDKKNKIIFKIKDIL